MVSCLVIRLLSGWQYKEKSPANAELFLVLVGKIFADDVCKMMNVLRCVDAVE